MADTLKPATFVALKDADPEGDVLLLIGPPNELKSLLVSSKVLSLASPVFNKMLQIPRFLEGVERSSNVPLQLPLPEDNPEAVTWLCNAIHLSRSVDHDVSFSLFEELAILCDKYDIASAITPWSRWWLQKWKGSPDGEDKYLKMLYISYAYGSYHAFRVSSRNIVLYSTAKDFETYLTLQNQNDTGLNILPETLLGR